MPEISWLTWLIIGILCCCIAVFLIIRMRLFVKSATATSGKIIETKKYFGLDYTIIVRYYDKSKRKYEHKTTIGWLGRFLYKKGRKFTVLYDPISPYRAKLKTFYGLWGVPLFFGVLGIMFLTLFLLAFLIR
jgi:hypothetical protein